jgi:SAM-dependent methyltransferase
MTKLNKDYWDNRYENHETAWDAGQITVPLREYIDQITQKNLKILIPGAGNAHEFDYLMEQSFTDVTVVDFAHHPIEKLKEKHPSIEKSKFLLQDFFEIEGQFDLILEQTFFCALDPTLRKKYVEKMCSILEPKGKIVGLLFDFPLSENGPPFGGSLKEYESLFKEHFHIKKLEKAYNSIKPRANKELFFIFEKKTNIT